MLKTDSTHKLLCSVICFLSCELRAAPKLFPSCIFTFPHLRRGPCEGVSFDPFPTPPPPSHQRPARLSTAQILISDNKTNSHCGSCLCTLLLWRASWVIGNTGPECFGDVRHQNVSPVKETKYLQQHFLGSVSKTGPLLFSITVFIHRKLNQPSVLNIWGHNTETTIVHNVAQSCNQLGFFFSL